MPSEMKELNFKFCLILPNLNSYIRLVATLMNRSDLKKTKIHIFLLSELPWRVKEAAVSMEDGWDTRMPFHAPNTEILNLENFKKTPKHN